jgi:DNA-binding NarL/FixJ family response regulator
MTRVAIVDDDHLVRTGLKVIVDAEPDLAVVAQAATGEEALTRCAELRPDVVLMDVRMPDMDGIETTRRLVDADPSPPKVLVVTTFEYDEYVYGALAAGASGFVLKRAEPSELVAAIRTVVAGESLVLPALTRRLIERYSPRPVPHDHRRRLLATLTEREAEVLRLVAAGRSNREIAADLVIGVQTAKTHVRNLLAKLHARDRTQAVIIAYETGFLARG